MSESEIREPIQKRSIETKEKIIEAGHEVVLVVTQPDKPKGRSGELQPCDV